MIRWTQLRRVVMNAELCHDFQQRTRAETSTVTMKVDRLRHEHPRAYNTHPAGVFSTRLRVADPNCVNASTRG